MPVPSEFPHLRLTYRGEFEPKFQGGPHKYPEVDRNKADPGAHAERLRRELGRWVVDFEEVRRERERQGLPAVPADHGFILRVPEGSDGDAIAHALGVELVAETDVGLMLVATKDLTMARLRDVLAKFELGQKGGRTGATVLEVFDGPEDARRLDQILTEDVRALWPFDDTREYIFDLGVQSAESTRKMKWPRCRKKKTETDEAFEIRKTADRVAARIGWSEAWDANMETRLRELEPFVAHAEYRGTIIAGPMNAPEQEFEDGLIFPDSFQVRVRMRGAGFKDVLRNFAHLFEIAVPDDVTQPAQEFEGTNATDRHLLNPPSTQAPAVCVIDSGIQEGHRWLAAAIDARTSKNFIPGEDAADVADRVLPRGHGTGVAGAVLYPREIPQEEETDAVAWIQNARVLTAENKLPPDLPPERYLAAVVYHFQESRLGTKLFNHSINSKVPCPKRRMSAWAAKLDELSHRADVLFLQSAGNLDCGTGTQGNPGLRAHLEAGLNHPEQLLADSSRIANPAQSLHALTVGSVAHETFDGPTRRSFAREVGHPSGFSRTGFAPPWSAVKPDVVEFGGDVAHEKAAPHLIRNDQQPGVELLNSTLHGGSAFSKDGAGTSFATPKVAHIAAHLQQLLPDASPLLYRTLIVQSARWPAWEEGAADKDQVLRLVGYGLPTLERATNNAPNRVTLITPQAVELRSKQFHLFSVSIPEDLRGPAAEAKIRVDVTMAYTAEPRRTRARNRSYLETWLDWESSNLGEPIAEFQTRMASGGRAKFPQLPWMMRRQDNLGIVEETNRTRGTVQKDWAVFDAYDFPDEFAIAVRGHVGWNHRAGAGAARYCLAVSFEVLGGEIPIYERIRDEIRPEVRTIVI